jgi:PHP family Zn ribbon phosphoesterase
MTFACSTCSQNFSIAEANRYYYRCPDCKGHIEEEGVTE